jgi:hypothetical protein
LQVFLEAAKFLPPDVGFLGRIGIDSFHGYDGSAWHPGREKVASDGGFSDIARKVDYSYFHELVLFAKD